MKRRRRSLAGLLVLLVVAGCSLADSGAERDAKDRAKQLGWKMTMDLTVRRHTAAELARRVQTERDVTILRADGRPRDQNAVIVLKIYAEDTASMFHAGSEATLCFRYRIGEYGDGYDKPKVVDCPAGPALVIPDPPPKPSLPNDAVERVTASLKGLPNTEPASVRAAVGASITEPGATFDVLAYDGWTGVAVQVGNGCLLGRVRGKSVEVWIPPRVTVQPGELTCTGDTAAQGLAKRNPH